MTFATITENKPMTELAEQAYTETKEDFIKWFSDFLEDRIAIGLAQIENGETCDFESFKKGLIGYTLNPKKYENLLYWSIRTI